MQADPMQSEVLCAVSVEEEIGFEFVVWFARKW